MILSPSFACYIVKFGVLNLYVFYMCYNDNQLQKPQILPRQKREHDTHRIKQIDSFKNGQLSVQKHYVDQKVYLVSTRLVNIIMTHFHIRIFRNWLLKDRTKYGKAKEQQQLETIQQVGIIQEDNNDKNYSFLIGNSVFY